MRDIPGNLVPIRDKAKWIDMIYRSYLSPEEKLAGSVLYFTVKWNKKNQCFMTECSHYSVSRILNMNKEEAEKYLSNLEKLGWIWDSGESYGARKRYIICVNVEPTELRK